MVDAASSGDDFQPFAVQCVSCLSRLKVSNPALIGTIVNCPKCNSFVQIDPPSTHPSAKTPPSPPPAPDVSDPTPAVPQLTLGDESIGSEAVTEAGMSVGDLAADFADAGPQNTGDPIRVP
ncbi:MAG: hypothetical protein ACF8AM_22070, partial [Rhodopirellula sp. JB055]